VAAYVPDAQMESCCFFYVSSEILGMMQAKKYDYLTAKIGTS
jgi:hypothetical protein